MSVTIGQPAPVFTLYDTDKKQISLQDFKGKNVLLLFFPLAFTSVCTKELCDIRDNISFYNNVNAVVLGISVDSLYTLKKFKEDQELNFSLLSDFNKTVSAAYDSLHDIFPSFEMQGVGKRGAFVIDTNGLVKYAEICASPSDLPNFNNIQAILSQLD